MEKQPIIEFKGVTKRFGERTILNNVDFKIFEGEVTTLIGLSGTGKSVTLKHIIGLLKPDAGQILYRGKPIDEMSKKEWNAYIGQISYMFQNNALFDSMTVFENVALPLRQTTHLDKKTIKDRVLAAIEQTELSEVFDKYPSELSGGMQKRAALARALVTDPSLVLFDEPTTGLHFHDVEQLLRVLHRLRDEGNTVVVIEHNLDVIKTADWIVDLGPEGGDGGGRVIAEGTPEQVAGARESYTGRYLGPILTRAGGKARRRA